MSIIYNDFVVLRLIFLYIIPYLSDGDALSCRNIVVRTIFGCIFFFICLIALLVCVKQYGAKPPYISYFSAQFSADSEKAAVLWPTRREGNSYEVEELAVHVKFAADAFSTHTRYSLESNKEGGSPMLRFSDDSRHLAALSPGLLLLINLSSREAERIVYPGEEFESFAWLDSENIAFLTKAENGARSYWSLGLHEPPVNRRLVYSVPSTHQLFQTSPQGRVAILSPLNSTQSEWLLINLSNGATGSLQSVGNISWSPDDSSFLSYLPERTYLFSVATLTLTDLTDTFRREFPQFPRQGGEYNEGATLYLAPLWTPDGKYIVGYLNKYWDKRPPEKFFYAENIGYLINPEPFEIVLTTEGRLLRTPFPDWLIQELPLPPGSLTSQYQWIRYDGKQTKPARYNDWSRIYSPNGKFELIVTRSSSGKESFSVIEVQDSKSMPHFAPELHFYWLTDQNSTNDKAS